VKYTGLVNFGHWIDRFHFSPCGDASAQAWSVWSGVGLLTMREYRSSLYPHVFLIESG